MNEIPAKRIEPLSRACAAAVVAILKVALLEKKPADRLLAGYLRAHKQLGSRDRRIISETLFSLLRWWGWLKHLAPELTPSPLAGKKDETGRLLPIQPALAKEYEPFFPALAACWYLDNRPELPPSVYWWLFQSGVQKEDIPVLPHHAELHERRKLLRPFFGGGEMPPMPLEDLIPAWALPKVTEQQISIPKLLEWLQQRPPVWLRAQSRDLDRLEGELNEAGVSTQRSMTVPLALKASVSGVNLRMLPAFQNGFVEVQDLASQCIGLVANPQQGENWWDCCAGAGGKTLHLSWLMKGTGTILATDKRLFKLDDLKKRQARTGKSNIRCKEWLGIDVPRYHNLFKGVLLDSPCSCSGTWRRNPDARWTTQPEDVMELVTLQKTLLENASHAVQPGGVFIYATCSMFTEENQLAVQDFLAKHPEFELEDFANPLNGTPCHGMLQIWPWDGNCDAMFVARMRRKEASSHD